MTHPPQQTEQKVKDSVFDIDVATARQTCHTCQKLACLSHGKGSHIAQALSPTVPGRLTTLNLGARLRAVSGTSPLLILFPGTLLLFQSDQLVLATPP